MTLARYSIVMSCDQCFGPCAIPEPKQAAEVKKRSLLCLRAPPWFKDLGDLPFQTPRFPPHTTVTFWCSLKSFLLDPVLS